jgi:hypothetical protein
MTTTTTTRLFWRVMQGTYVHSTWATPGEAQRMADQINADPRTTLSFHVEAWS